MPNITANGIHIEYDTFGSEDDFPLLLIMGLGAQMLLWDEEICEQLAQLNLFVIRFDNRDVGLSSKIEYAEVPDLFGGETDQSIYTLDDMADDAVGLLAALSIDKAHICGFSLGSAIAQAIAIRHPSTVQSLILISGTTGNPDLPPPTAEAMELFMQPVPVEREKYIDRIMSDYKVFFGSGYILDEEWFRNLTAQLYDRSFCPVGITRQIHAGMAHGDRRSALRSVITPTLVIHGDEDPVLPVECGKDVACVIPEAELMIVKGMGHDMPHGGAWPKIIEAIAKHVQKGYT